jgi:predicted nuclease of predicted toxin-antitoxin system
VSLPLLLDEHIPPQVARLLRRRGFDVVAMQEWRGGIYVSRPDEEILLAAQQEQRTLVTYDVRSIPGLLARFLDAGTEHAGVILINQKTVPSQDVAGIARSLERLLRLHGDRSLRNGVLFAAK